MRDQAPEDARIHAALGMALASLGEDEAALRAARHATELLPVEREVLRGSFLMDDLARTQARLGDHAAALATLARLLASRNHAISPGLARLDPEWRGLREDPRFESLLNGLRVAFR
jgi:Flp pilus assembly protein TadD